MRRPRHQLKDVLFLFAFNVSLAEFTCRLWVIILHEYKSFTHKPPSIWHHVIQQYAAIAGMIKFFAFHLVQIPSFAICKSPHTHTHHDRSSSMLYSWCDTRGGSFHQLFTAHRLSYMSQISDSSGPYCTALFFKLCLLLPTGAFWYCFTSSTVVSWRQFYHTYRPASLSLLLKVEVDIFFHDIGSIMLWCL